MKIYKKDLTYQLTVISQKCVNCKLCQQECRFLQKYGKPGKIAENYDPSNTEDLSMPFGCSLCALCAAVCPVDIDPSMMFLEMRKESIRRDSGTYGTDCVYLGYETRGTSKHLSYYALPRHCETVYFPGCSYPAGRPKETVRLFNFLRQKFPDIGIVLDCCTKPSHDLGRTAEFETMFAEMRGFLLANGIKNVLVNCPNCYKIFDTYGRDLKVQTVYEVMADSELRIRQVHTSVVTIHDPCVLRNEDGIHDAIRCLLERSGIRLYEMKHSRRQTICCGEGGSVDCSVPELAREWKGIRLAETAGNPMVTYCAGCVNRYGRHHPSTHILDLFFRPENNLKRNAFSPGFPLSCVNRIRLKNHFQNSIEAAVTRERTLASKSLKRLPLLNRNRLAFYISKAVAGVLGR